MRSRRKPTPAIVWSAYSPPVRDGFSVECALPAKHRISRRDGRKIHAVDIAGRLGVSRAAHRRDQYADRGDGDDVGLTLVTRKPVTSPAATIFFPPADPEN